MPARNIMEVTCDADECDAIASGPVESLRESGWFIWEYDWDFAHGEGTDWRYECDCPNCANPTQMKAQGQLAKQRLNLASGRAPGPTREIRTSGSDGFAAYIFVEHWGDQSTSVHIVDPHLGESWAHLDPGALAELVEALTGKAVK